MTKRLTKKEHTLTTFFRLLNELRDEGILLNKTNFNCQLGEWLVETIYEGKRAANCNQEGWDIKIKNKRVQVKTHAKAETNKNRWSYVNTNSPERVDELIIVQFSADYKLKAFYKVPWRIVAQKSKTGCKGIYPLLETSERM